MSPARQRRSASRRELFAALLVALVPLAIQIARAGSLSSIAPAGVSVGQAINITGTGFDPTASNNTVTLTPASGPAATATGIAIATLDPTTGLRRLTITVPSSLPVGTASVRVTNRISGDVSDARPLDIVSLALPDVTSAVPGATSVVVRVTGSPNSKFVAGNTRAAFGTGITVRSTTVDSATSLRATIDVASTATLGPRDVAVISTTQRAVLTGGFTVGAPPPTNQPPAVSAGPDLTVTLPDTATLNGTATDDGLPSGSTLTTTWTAVSGPGTVAFANPAARSTTASFSVDGTYVLRLTGSDSALSASDDTTITVNPANRKPTITSTPVVTGAEGQAYSYQVAATDPDGDPLTFTLTQAPQGMTISPTGLIGWTPSASQLGAQNAAIEVADGRGGVETQSFSVVVSAVITSIDVTPALVRFSTVGATRPLSIAGVRPDGSTIDLTGQSDLAYASNNTFVATVDNGGVVHAVANGTATITVTRGALTDTAAVAVEAGVTLDSIDVSPATQTLRSLGASFALTVQGHFSSGDTRDLTTAAGTTYESSNAAIASVDASGRVTAAGIGDATITVRADTLSGSSAVHVVVSTGAGFATGTVFDDVKGLPLAGATVALVADGSGPLAQPPTVTADDRGRFAIEGQAGDAVVRITKPGFTAVERRATIPAASAVRLLDARLTTVDARPNPIASAFGGEARDSAGAIRLAVTPGVMTASSDLRITSISGQGLEGRLPFGWSPVAAVDVGPGGVAFAQAATLTLPNAAGAPANSDVVVAAYDLGQHDWIVAGSSHVSADGKSIVVSISATGQIVCVTGDDAPFTPPAANTGAALAGVAPTDVPVDATATGEVVPRSAPPSVDVRASGRVLLQNPAPLPSGSVVRAQVSEHFDLTDQSQVVPPPFSEDIVLFARGRPAGAGVLGAAFPITPSRSYTIQELSRGVVSIDVTRPGDGAAAAIVGAAGGTASDATGDTFDVPAGALAGDAAIALARVDADGLAVAVPAGFDLLGAVQLDLAGAALSQAGRLSIPTPPTFNGTDQVVLAMAFADPAGALRLRIAGIATADAGRLASQTSLGTLTFAGARSGGEYLFLRPQQPIGFVAGRVIGTDTLPRAGAVVTADTAPFADVSTATSAFIIGARAGADVLASASDPANRDAATQSAHVTSRDEIVTVDLTLALSVPTVTATNPAASATNVPLGSSIVLDFSVAIDPASVSTSSVVLQGGSTSVAGQRLLSSDRRRLTFRPDAPLDGKTAFTLTLNGLHSAVGRTVGTFTLTFTTLDPTKPTTTGSGLITGELPDEDGFVLITGGPGAADANAAVTATNLRTQETATVLAAADGSFRVRVSAAIGDQLTITLRDSAGRDATISLTQLQSSDGSTALGDHGGTFTGPHARTGTVLPRALSQPGLFRLDDPSAGSSAPALPDGFSYADRFRLSIQAAQFTPLSSFTLTESQNRFAPQTSTANPFSGAADVTVPADFLVNGSLRFTATAVDTSGIRRSATASTLVVSSGADTTTAENSQSADFPTVFITASKQAAPNQVTHVSAVAPTARIELEVPVPSGADPASTFLLVRSTTINGTPALLIVDTLTPFTRDNTTLLHTTGRALPGMSAAGDYAIVSSRDAIAFVTGHLSGPTAVATLDGSPFAFQTDGPNGSFALPVSAGQPFAIHYVNAATGAPLGSSNGQAPASGGVDLGQPLAPVGSQLTVTVDPDPQAVVDIGTPITFHFSEPVDARTLTTGVVVTDSAGARTFGTVAVASDGVTATFKPTRRWRFGTTYRWGVGASVVALSGARQAQAASGTFTTFAPSIVSTSAIGTAHDVAVNGSLAVAATDTGLVAIDVSSPLAPVVQAQLPLAGGAHGVALLPSATFTDHNGQSHTGTFAAVASGDATAPGRLDIVDVTTAASPAAIGSTQVSPSGGTPRGVALTSDQRAIVAVQGIGAAAVAIGDSVPADPANPSRAVTARYPPSGTDSVNQAALLGDRIVTAGAGGLEVLDASTLARKAGISTTGDARGVAVLPTFSMDVNGDGAIGSDETFDLAVVANGADGTLQFVRVPAMGDPTLLSVVHFTGETTSVAVDATERLAYVGLGARGVGIVDLDGPASVQPIDADRNGTDDRVLALVDTGGTAERAALALNRGLLVVADGAGGIATLQVLPPRTSFITLTRDAVSAFAGEEQDILLSRRALTTDDALRVGVTAVVPPGETVVLAIDEAGPAARLLHFADGSIAAPLTNGLNDLTIAIHGTPSDLTRQVRLVARNGRGADLAALDIQVESAAGRGGQATVLFGAPAPVRLGSTQLSAQLAIGAGLTDGRAINVTLAASGTRYSVLDSRVATVTADGLVQGIAGGATRVVVANGPATTTIDVSVDLPVSITGFTLLQHRLTLTAAGATETLAALARFSDGTQFDALQGLGTRFTSSDPDIVTVSGTGIVTAVHEGVATITMTNGAASTTFDVAVEFRVAPTVSAISVTPIAATPTQDDKLRLEARLTGTGSIEQLPVTFAVSGAVEATVTTATDYDGIAIAYLEPLSGAGAITIAASVTDPSSGLQRTATQTAAIAAGTGDAEPNSDIGSASLLAVNRTAAGTLDASDLVDVYRTTTKASGTVTMTLSLADGAPPDAVTVRFLAADGSELLRGSPASATSRFSQLAAPGPVYFSVQGDGRPVSYTLASSFSQSDLTLTSVAPLSGTPGTTVAIAGTGFTNDADRTRVLFGGIAGKILSVSNTQIAVAVPARAVDGPVLVISGDRRVTGPQFDAGRSGPYPHATFQPDAPRQLRFDPALGVEVDVTRLSVFVDPLVTDADVSSLAASVGATIIGTTPSLNVFVFALPTNQKLATLHATVHALRADPRVRLVDLSVPGTLASTGIDARDNGNADAFDLVRVFDAIEAIRSTPPFSTDRSAFSDVKVAVVDSGFNPKDRSEFDFNGQSIVTFYAPDAVSWQFAPAAFADPGEDSHGTAVTSIIAAINNGVDPSRPVSVLSGVLNSVLAPSMAPFPVQVYGISALLEPTTPNPAPTPGLAPTVPDPRAVSSELWFNALDDLAAQGDIDVINMSEGSYWLTTAEFENRKRTWNERLLSFSGRTLLVVAAGNEGAHASNALPCALSRERSDLLCVGGIDVAENRRLLAAGTKEQQPLAAQILAQGLFCFTYNDAGKKAGAFGSNCGPEVTLAASGDVVAAQGADDSGPGWQLFSGTSAATPVVSGVAALVQAIRGRGVPPLQADALLDTLHRTSDVMTAASWAAFPGGDPTNAPELMLRLDALTAVRTILPTATSQPVYVVNQGSSTGGGPAGVIVGLELDPMTGRPFTPPADDVVIPLTFDAVDGSVTFAGQTPYSLVPSPTGTFLYVVVGTTTAFGDGVMVVNTANNRAEDFIPFSGATFPPRTMDPLPPAVKVASVHAPMVISRDGRLLYVGTSLGLQIINLEERILVRQLTDLPSEYDYQAAQGPLAARPPPGALAQRLQLIRTTIDQFAFGVDPCNPPAPNTGEIRSLALSPDGRTLYAAVSSGSCSGNQPGLVLVLNVDLYSDAEPAMPGLQPPLGEYLLPAKTTPATGSGQPIGPLSLPNAGDDAGGDEPSGVAVDPDGKHVYLVHGGIESVSAYNSSDLFAAKFAHMIGGPGFGIAAVNGFSGDVAGIGSELASAANSLDYLQLRGDLQQIAADGFTILSAPGYTGVFDVNPASQHAGESAWLFPSTVAIGWHPTRTAADGTVSDDPIIDQSHFREVFSARPFAMTIRPFGGRAIVAMAETGNFGVFDTSLQAAFQTIPNPNPVFAALPSNIFQGVAAVTPAIRLGADLIPKRGAFSSGGIFVRSDDERLLYPWQVEYAQNGKFAVATHEGSRPPGTVTFPVPDFHDGDMQTRLAEHGFTLPTNGSFASITGPDGQTYNVGSSMTLDTGGGAVSVIRDAAVDANLQAFGNQTAHVFVSTAQGLKQIDRPWFSAAPVCEVPGMLTGGPNIPSGDCQTEAVDHIYTYHLTGSAGSVPLDRPRGVTIYPYVHFESPVFGDHVQRDTAVVAGWRDPRIQSLQVGIYDLTAVDANGAPTFKRGEIISLSPQQQSSRSASAEFAGLFNPNDGPVDGHRYRIDVQFFVVPQPANVDQELSETRIDVGFEDYSTPVLPAHLTIAPTILAISMAPATGGTFVTRFTPQGTSGAPSQDVTAAAEYVSEVALPAAQDAITKIRSILNGPAASGPVDFGEAGFSITGGTITISKPGLQVIQAKYNDVYSNLSVVLAGFQIQRVSLEPIVESAFEQDTLGSRILTALGSGSNAPIVIEPTDSTFVDDGNAVLLGDVTLRFTAADGATGLISLNELMDAIRPLIAGEYDLATRGAQAPIGATPTWRNTQALVSLMQAPNAPTLKYNLTYSTSDAATAFVTEGGFFNARVASNSSGLAIVSGILDLGGFGQGADGILVWSLPALESAVTKPKVVQMKRSDAPLPGPTIRGRARTMKADAVIPTPPGFPNETIAVREIVPTPWLSSLQISVDASFGTDFTFDVSGHGFAVNNAITLSDFVLSFDVPNDQAPEVRNTFTVADPNIVTLGLTDTFDQHLVHQNRIGTTPIDQAVHVDGLGDAHGTSQAIVCDCTGPVISKRLLTPTSVQPGDIVQYEITVLNPTTAPLTNIVITDEFRLNGAVIATNTLTVASLDADDFVTLPVQITAPPGGGVLENAVHATGFTAIQPPPVTVAATNGSIVITELVVDPKQDWSDSAGGNGVPFDASPGNGVVDSDDVWVEVMNPTTGTQNWTVRLTDAASATFSKVLGPPALSGPQVRVLSGFGPMTLPITKLELVDDQGLVRQTLDITAINQILGGAADASTESLTWSVFGSPTPVLQQFVRRPATIGVFSPF